MKLVVAPCTREAAKYAVEHWHYSHVMPAGKLVHFGVWEDQRFVGTIVFGRGASNVLLSPYGLKQSEGCELVRVAMRDHITPVSQVVAAALKLLRETNTGLRVVVSFADPEQGHHGGIYQAGNWLYLGKAHDSTEYIVGGKQVHGRSSSSMLKGKPKRQAHESRAQHIQRVLGMRAELIRVPGKHRYIMPLDKQMRRRLLRLIKQYPAAEVSTAIQRASGAQGQVRLLPAAQEMSDA